MKYQIQECISNKESTISIEASTIDAHSRIESIHFLEDETKITCTSMPRQIQNNKYNFYPTFAWHPASHHQPRLHLINIKNIL